MTNLITDRPSADPIVAERQRTGADRFDEVWEGVYFVAPNPNNHHQSLAADLIAILKLVVEWPGLGQVSGAPNVSDRAADWQQNFRIPDVAVFLNGTRAEDHDTHWLGGPDFAVEIISHDDRSRAKLDFYARVGVRELLLIDRDPWQLELYRLQAGALVAATRATADNAVTIASDVVPLTFALVSDARRPKVKVIGPGERTWLL